MDDYKVCNHHRASTSTHDGLVETTAGDTRQELQVDCERWNLSSVGASDIGLVFQDDSQIFSHLHFARTKMFVLQLSWGCWTDAGQC